MATFENGQARNASRENSYLLSEYSLIIDRRPREPLRYRNKRNAAEDGVRRARRGEKRGNKKEGESPYEREFVLAGRLK